MNKIVLGSKVIYVDNFLTELYRVITSHDFTISTIPGQAYIRADGLTPFVSSGVGRHTNRPEDYVLREHRGKVGAYLSRKFAEPVTGCAVVVYTFDAYIKDPEVQSEEVDRLAKKNCTHVLVALLAEAGPPSPLSPSRLVSNLAGGNREALVWDADTIRAKAKESHEYYKEWATISD